MVIALKTSVLVLPMPDVKTCLEHVTTVLQNESPRAIYCMEKGPTV
jgi:hypothetical protein